MAVNKKDKRNIKIFQLILVILFLIYVLVSYSSELSLSVFNENNNEKTEIVDGNLNIYFIDVGQADAIMIQENDKYILIDAGNNADGNLLVNYFKELGIDNFLYVFGTHAHEDHIGGMDDIIKNFNIENFYMPDAITTTRTFEDVLDALNEKNITLQTPKIGEMFNIDGVSLECLYVGSDESDLNNTSIVLRLVYGEVSFLFMGDATKIVEDKLLNKEIQSDILKVGHHGSQYSSKETFIKEVSPTYAVISVGKNNTYKHPAELTIKTLNKYDAKVLRTDELGTIIFSSDGKRISYKTEETNTNG